MDKYLNITGDSKVVWEKKIPIFFQGYYKAHSVLNSAKMSHFEFYDFYIW